MVVYRLEQAHNDYLQVCPTRESLGPRGLFFVFIYSAWILRAESKMISKGVALGALAGCFAVLVHSFFDFTLHTTSNAMLFLVLAAVATMNGRVEQTHARRVRRRRWKNTGEVTATPVAM